MSDVLGQFPDDLSFAKHIEWTLQTGWVSKSVQWHLSHLCVDFITKYYQTLFAEQHWQARLIQPEQCADAIRFVVNELLENAVKYNHSGEITIKVGLEVEQFVCITDNQVPDAAVPWLRETFAALLTQETDERFNHQVAKNFRQTGEKQSGLGFLILQRDYSASLGWKFNSVLLNRTCLQTMVRIPICKE